MLLLVSEELLGKYQRSSLPSRASEDVKAQPDGNVIWESNKHRNTGGTFPVVNSVQATNVCLALRQALRTPTRIRRGYLRRAFQYNVLLMMEQVQAQ